MVILPQVKVSNHSIFFDMYKLNLSLASGILISGGRRTPNTVEVWSPSTSCSLPNFSVKRSGHSQDGLLACGSTADSTSGWATCDRFENGRENPVQIAIFWNIF